MAATPRHKCPTCQRPISWDEAFPFRPFCSERCKLVDFGAWVSGERAIPGEPAVGEEPGAPGEPGEPRPGGGLPPRGLH